MFARIIIESMAIVGFSLVFTKSGFPLIKKVRSWLGSQHPTIKELVNCPWCTGCWGGVVMGLFEDNLESWLLLFGCVSFIGYLIGCLCWVGDEQ